ncbi:MAG: hypothetical protein ACKODH_03975, partial [Limisphaerales bacterium]
VPVLDDWPVSRSSARRWSVARSRLAAVEVLCACGASAAGEADGLTRAGRERATDQRRAEERETGQSSSTGTAEVHDAG